MSIDSAIDADLNGGVDLLGKETGYLLRRNGYVYIRSVPAGFKYPDFLSNLGPLVPQYDGELIWSIKAEPQYEDVYHSLNSKELMPHTECTELDGLPPKYLALWCLTPASDGGGRTTLCDLYAFLATITQDERTELASRNYKFSSTPGLQRMQLGHTASHPVLEERGALPPVMRISYTCMEGQDDPFIQDIGDRLLRFVAKTEIAIDFSVGSLLIWDNHRMAHARTPFTDQRRHLRRVWLGENGRR